MIDPASLPREPGVYLFKDARGQIIYVGKAKSLRSRVSSYFSKSHQHTEKTLALVASIRDIDFIIVDNELEALLLENKLIKQHWPRFNITLKDSKTYAYIHITGERFPRVLSVRKPQKKGVLLGPFVGGYSRAEVVALANKLFQLRTCRNLPKKECLNYHIGLCTAPCIGKVDEVQYGAQIEKAMQFLKGDTKPIIRQLEREMRVASERLQFETALQKRNQLQSIAILKERQKVDRHKRFDQDVISIVRANGKAAIELLTIRKGVIAGKKEFRFDDEPDVLQSFIKAFYSQNQVPREVIISEKVWEDDSEKSTLESYLARFRGSPVRLTVPQKGEKRGLVLLAEKNAQIASEDRALTQLKDALNLPSLPRVIECFDISNLKDEAIVAGMTRWVDGKPDKSGYRKFLMRGVRTQDDFRSMSEAVFRRYKRLIDEKKEMPDLILIDGGPGQLNAALESLRRLGLKVPIISLAKREEEIYTPENPVPLVFDKKSRMMLLLRAIRDSVHRFSITYNRKRRQMKLRGEAKK